MSGIDGNIGGNFNTLYPPVNHGPTTPPLYPPPSGTQTGHAELSGLQNKASDSGATKRARAEVPKNPDLKDIAKGSEALGAEATKVGTDSASTLMADMRALNLETQKFSYETGLMKLATDMAQAAGKQIGKIGTVVKDGQN